MEELRLRKQYIDTFNAGKDAMIEHCRKNEQDKHPSVEFTWVQDEMNKTMSELLCSRNKKMLYLKKWSSAQRAENFVSWCNTISKEVHEHMLEAKSELVKELKGCDPKKDQTLEEKMNEALQEAIGD